MVLTADGRDALVWMAAGHVAEVGTPLFDALTDDEARRLGELAGAVLSRNAPEVEYSWPRQWQVAKEGD